MAIGASALAVPGALGSLATSCGERAEAAEAAATPTVTPRGAGLPVTGTFLDEISHDIPHQNWGEAEWDADFAHMKRMGIDTVIMIRSGYRKFITYPSEYLTQIGRAHV